MLPLLIVTAAFIPLALAVRIEIDKFESATGFHHTDIVVSDAEEGERLIIQRRARGGKGKKDKAKQKEALKVKLADAVYIEADKKKKQIEPPLLPKVTLYHLAAHRRDVADARRVVKEFAEPVKEAVAMANQEIAAVRKVDTETVATGLEALEPLAPEDKWKCYCNGFGEIAEMFAPRCVIQCNLAAGTLTASMKLLSVTSFGTGMPNGSQIPYARFNAELNGRLVDLSIQLSNKGPMLELESGSLFEGAQHEEDTPKVGESRRLAKLKIRFPEEQQEMPHEIFTYPWSMIKTLYRSLINKHVFLESKEAFGKLVNIGKNKMPKKPVTVSLSWSTLLSTRLTILSSSLDAMSSVAESSVQALDAFQKSAAELTEELEKATIAIEPGMAIAFGSRPRAVANRLQEALDRLLKNKTKVSAETERMLAAVRISKKHSWLIFKEWKNSFRLFDDDRPGVDKLSPLEPPNFKHVELAVSSGASALGAAVGKISSLLERTVARASRLLQPGNPPMEVESLPLITALCPHEQGSDRVLEPSTGGSEHRLERTQEEHDEFLRVFVDLDLAAMETEGVDMNCVRSNLEAAKESAITGVKQWSYSYRPWYMDYKNYNPAAYQWVKPVFRRPKLVMALQTKADDKTVLEDGQELLRAEGNYPFSPMTALVAGYNSGEPVPWADLSPKMKWAARWSEFRKALEFLPWPVDMPGNPLPVPTICESTYFNANTGEQARFPGLNLGIAKIGGDPILHTFMVYAGGELPERRGCLDVLSRLARDFPDMSPRTAPRHDTPRVVSAKGGTYVGFQQDYQRALEEASELGCLRMVPWGIVAPVVQEQLMAHIGQMPNFTVTIKRFTDTIRDVSLEIAREEVHQKKGRKRGPKNRVSKGIVIKITKWVMHCLAKYASRKGPELWEGAKASLLKTAPQIDVYDLSEPYVSQLEAFGLNTPFSNVMCAQPGKECNDWNNTLPGFWSHGAVTGLSLQHIVAFIDKAKDSLELGDWRLLAQTAQLYGATGFDSAGTIDNSDWDCEQVESTCKVHPTCARAAAQMLTYPWAGSKKYASGWADKFKTWYGSGKGKFDSDGFHTYCHVEGEGYCWAYTHCIKEMMKWLCHDESTADRCCPNDVVRTACHKDVNSKDCDVCVAPPRADEVAENITHQELVLQREVPDEATLAWLQPSAEDEKQLDMEVEKEEQAAQCEVCAMLEDMKQPETGDAIWWMLVETNPTCEANIMFCGEVCGLYSGEGKFLKPDELDDCEGWRNRCREKCPKV